MAKDNTITILVSAAVIIILVAALITSIASESQLKTTKLVGTENTTTTGTPYWTNGLHRNESYVYTITYPPTGWKVDDCPIATFVMTNSSGQTLTSGTDYTFNSGKGTYSILDTLNTNKTANNYTARTYYYCADDYLNSSWGRNILNLTPGLIAIALLILAVYAAYQLLGGAAGIKDYE